MLLAFVPLAEWRLGSRRTVATFFAGDWVGTVATMGALQLLAAGGRASISAALHALEAGTSEGAYAVLAALAMSIPSRRGRMIAMAVVMSSILGPLVVYTRVFDVEHLLAVSVGAGMAWGWSTRARAKEHRAVVDVEDRTRRPVAVEAPAR